MIMDFRVFDSNMILILTGGIPRPTGDFPEGLSQGLLAGMLLVGRLGVVEASKKGSNEKVIRFRVTVCFSLLVVGTSN